MSVSFDLVSAAIDACFQPLQHPCDRSGIVAYATMSLHVSLDVRRCENEGANEKCGRVEEMKKKTSRRPNRKNFTTTGVHGRFDGNWWDTIFKPSSVYNGLNFISHQFFLTPSPPFFHGSSILIPRRANDNYKFYFDFINLKIIDRRCTI